MSSALFRKTLATLMCAAGLAAPLAAQTIIEVPTKDWCVQDGGESIVPVFYGMTVQDAEKLARECRLTFKEMPPAISGEAAGTIVSQSVAPMTKVESGYPVSVAQSGGFPLPGFISFPQQVAESWLKRYDISYKIKKVPSKIYPLGTVFRQDPPSTTMIHSGSHISVILYVAMQES